MMTAKRWSFPSTSALALIAIATLGAPVDVQAQTGVISACVSTSNAKQGQLRIVGPAEQCKSTETLLTWNIDGPPGPTGATGASGPPLAIGGIRGRLVDQCVPNYNFTGTVVHVPGRAYTALLGADGLFALDVVRPGSYLLSVERNGSLIGSVPDVAVATAVVDLQDLNTSNLLTDPNNCGVCGQSCGGGACLGGVCQQPVGGVCTPGVNVSCYTGSAGTVGVGACVAGLRTCNAAGSGYGICQGEITPLAEVCGDNIDNDCDGLVDNGC